MRHEPHSARSLDPERARPEALCHAESFDAYAGLFTDLKWGAVHGNAGVPSLLVGELENRRSRLTLAPVPFDALPSLAREGWVRPVDAWLPPEHLAMYPPQALALATVDGRLYAVPDDITPFVLFVRTEVLEELRVGPPRTWDEFESLAAAATRRGTSFVLLTGGERARLGFLLSLLGSNGVAADSATALLRDARHAAEAYDWLRDRLIERGLLAIDEFVHPRVGQRMLRGKAGGFGWLSDLEHVPPAQLRRYVFLRFPRGPALGAGAHAWAPFKGSGWCLPWSREPPDTAVAVLRAIHTRTTLRALRVAERRPFLAVTSRWADAAVLRRFPLYRYAGELVGEAEPMLSGGPAHYHRLEVTFRNALLDRMDGSVWMEDYIGSDVGPRRDGAPPIRTVLRAIESLLGSVRGTGEIARALRMHPVTLRRLFLREMGEGITPYVRRRKMELARELLQTQRAKVKEVAARTGFRNADAFTRAYGRHWGTPPNAERRSPGTAAGRNRP